MRVFVEHRTEYVYERPFEHMVQALRLTPPPGPGQRILDWTIACPGIEGAVSYVDGFGNLVHLVTPPGPVSRSMIVARGTVETKDAAGIAGFTGEAAPPGVFLRGTPATRACEAIAHLARGCARPDRLSILHALMAAVRGKIAYEIGTTHAHTTAIDAFRDGRGVCQDHAHVFIAGARTLGIPARYVTGYLHMEGTETAAANHAWAEAFTDDLGWIGFDVANAVCPTDSYVRLAVGLDAAGAAPVRGIRLGRGEERLGVEVVVRECQQ
jgi:transglutaminase-like putative cysteine protease